MSVASESESSDVKAYIETFMLSVQRFLRKRDIKYFIFQLSDLYIGRNNVTASVVAI